MLHHRLRAASGARQNGGGGDIPTDYIAFYTMDNISGSTLVDETGNYDGTIYGATTTTGVIGDALSFDGVNDYVKMSGTITPFGALTGLAVSFWWYWPRGASFDVYASIIGNLKSGGDSVGSDYDGFAIQTISRGTIRWFGFGSGQAANNLHTIPLDQWVHCVAMWDGSGLIFVKNNVASARSPLTINDMGTTEELHIGKLPYAPLYAPGRVDLIRIYPRVLTSSEITALYEEGL